MSKVAITGSTGFIGKILLGQLLSLGESPVVIPRQTVGLVDILRGCDAVVHLAGRAHVRDHVNNESFADYRVANVDNTLKVAQEAALAGVKRFVFISSIGVNGVETFVKPFGAEDIESPSSSYAISKYVAELGLKAIAFQAGMEFVIIRPPLVYGPNAPGNFDSLLRWIKLGFPLPLGNVKNMRSFVALENLVDLIIVCCKHPSAANQIFLVSDGEDLSTTEFLHRIGRAMNKRVHLFSVPAYLLKIAAHLAGKDNAAQSLLGSLQVDIGKTLTLLDWKPPIAVDEGLRRATQ